jgi:hypothetical protein
MIRSEVQETKFPISSANPECPPDSPLLRWGELIKEAAANDGIDADPTPRFQEMLERTGFVNIRDQPIKWPIGSWPKGEREKLLGRMTQDNVLQFYRPAATALYTKRLGWTVDKLNEFLPGVEQDLLDRTKCFYAQM